MTFPQPETSVTTLLAVGDLEWSTAWYRDVLDATNWRRLRGLGRAPRPRDVAAPGRRRRPTADKPTVTFAPPSDPDRVSVEVIFGVRNCRSAYEALTARGAEFVAPPVEYEWEIRAFFRDPDGHLFEISQPKR
jgi:catechol 2,3-dioxygenase-like lactoylglutathione lyase family enzyme